MATHLKNPGNEIKIVSDSHYFVNCKSQQNSTETKLQNGVPEDIKTTIRNI